MQRSSQVVVLCCLWALVPARANAQATPTPDERPAAPRPAAAPPTDKPGPAGAASEGKPGGEPRRVEDRLSDEAELAKVVSLYEAGKYRECSDELERLLDPTQRAPLRQPGIVENARVYWAACLIGDGSAELAEAPLRAAIHENPQMKAPDSLVFPQPVVQRFFKVRDSLVTEIRAAEQTRIKQAQEEAKLREERLLRDKSRLRELEELAQQETIVVQNRRVLSFVPFGVGQIQNRSEALGYTLMASQVLLASASIAAQVVQSRLQRDVEQARLEGNSLDEGEVNSWYRTWGTVRTVSFWSFAVLAVGGVVEAQLDYQPEFREVRRRKLPPPSPPSVGAPSGGRGGTTAADVSALPYFDEHGGGLSVVGRF